MDLMPSNETGSEPEVIIAKPRFSLPPKIPLILGGGSSTFYQWIFLN